MASLESSWAFPESSGGLTRKAGAQGSLGGGVHQGVLRVCLTVGWRKGEPTSGPPVLFPPTSCSRQKLGGGEWEEP